MQFGELYNKNRTRSGRRSIFIVAGWIIGLLLVWSLISYLKPQSVFFSWSAPLHTFIRLKVHLAGQFFIGITRGQRIVRELEIYQKENQILTSRLVELEELKKENQFLRSAFSLSERFSFTLFPADVIAFQPNGFEEVLMIKFERGMPLERGMGVISDTGLLVGKLDSVHGSVGYVMLLTDLRMVLNAEVLGSGAVGSVKGTGLGAMKLDLVEKKFDIKSGDVLYTSASGGIFPEGIPFGKIKEVNNSDLAGFASASAQRIVDPRSLRKVFIITNGGKF